LIEGAVNDDGVPTIQLSVAGHDFTAVIDTGFNGDLELPTVLLDLIEARQVGQIVSYLAAGQSIEEDVYQVTFPFDGRSVDAQVTFAPGHEILIGTNLIGGYRLEVNFVSRRVILERINDPDDLS
jgi:clan AA aspartic protease